MTYADIGEHPLRSIMTKLKWGLEKHGLLFEGNVALSSALQKAIHHGRMRLRGISKK